jgi:Protein of unknown function (DUF2806)
MTKDDHLDKETSVSADVTPTGVKASARSRLVASIDRFCGNLFEPWSAMLERSAAETRALSAGRVQVIETLTKLGLDQLGADPELAKRAVANHLDVVLARQVNKDVVVAQAIEDLRREPPTEDEAGVGGDTLDETFLNRFERYAEEATTEQLRERWGRVLAAEVRRPGTFSSRVLRVVDEIDAETAKLFEDMCAYNLDDVLLAGMIDELSVLDQGRLTSSDLIIDPGLGQYRTFRKATRDDGKELWLGNFGEFGIALPADMPQNTLPRHATRGLNLFRPRGDEGPAVPIYVLTQTGRAIASILPNRRENAFAQLVAKVGEQLPGVEIGRYRKQGGGRYLRIEDDAVPSAEEHVSHAKGTSS